MKQILSTMIADSRMYESPILLLRPTNLANKIYLVNFVCARNILKLQNSTKASGYWQFYLHEKMQTFQFYILVNRMKENIKICINFLK